MIAFDDMAQNAKKVSEIFSAKEDSLSGISSGSDMIDGVIKFDT